MNIVDAISITELARLTQKTRPTVYKYVADYESGNTSAVPENVKVLFDKIVRGASKSEIYDYCQMRFLVDDGSELGEIVALLKANESRLDLRKIKQIIQKEINK